MTTAANAGSATKEGGLEDVIAGPSAICEVYGGDRERGIPGRLIYRGYDINDLAKYSTFEETTYLLWHGRLPTRAELSELEHQLQANRALPPEVLELMQRFPKHSTPMDVLRTTVSALQLWDKQENDDTDQANHQKALRLTAQMPTLVATWHRIRSGQEVIQPKMGHNTAEAFLYMLSGDDTDDVAERTLDVALILHADHELNASTFAARVTAATLSDVHSAITSAIGALIGPLHGGANEGVIRMLQEMGDISNVEPWIERELAQKRRIMGFGHRVYRTADPRATHLREMSRQLGERRGDLKFWEMSRKIEEVMAREKGLNANVDFYSASTYYALGVPIDLFTPVFAVSRIAGWTAHVLEQYANNRLIRPRAEYVGERNLTYVPIDQRA
ncbi:MAG TPA: citrate synthase [Chloroflexota bacterium]|jgi:citrate synthase|nr:citrate synthase [Chloroflexota bacterium]